MNVQLKFTKIYQKQTRFFVFVSSLIRSSFFIFFSFAFLYVYLICSNICSPSLLHQLLSNITYFLFIFLSLNHMFQNHVNQQYPHKWIGRVIDAHSPDLSSIDFFLGHLKNMVYKTSFYNEPLLLYTFKKLCKQYLCRKRKD